MTTKTETTKSDDKNNEEEKNDDKDIIDKISDDPNSDNKNNDDQKENSWQRQADEDMRWQKRWRKKSDNKESDDQKKERQHRHDYEDSEDETSDDKVVMTTKTWSRTTKHLFSVHWNFGVLETCMFAHNNMSNLVGIWSEYPEMFKKNVLLKFESILIPNAL